MNGLTDGVRCLVIPLALAYDTTHSAHDEAREILRNGGTPDPVPSRDHGVGEVAVVRIEPESYRVGPPPSSAPRKRSDRPFAPLLDAWLERGGWAAGRDGAGSVALVEDNPAERLRVKNAWRYETGVRDWTARQLTTRFVVEGDATRFYWWTRPEWAARYPPEEEAGRQAGTLEAMGVEDDDDGASDDD